MPCKGEAGSKEGGDVVGKIHGCKLQCGLGRQGLGQGDRLGRVSVGQMGGGASQGRGNRNGQKGVTWEHRKQGLVVLVRDEMKGQMILFPF